MTQLLWYPFAIVMLALTTIPGGFALGIPAGVLWGKKHKYRSLVVLLGLASLFVTYFVTHSNGLKLQTLDTTIAMMLTIFTFSGVTAVSARVVHGQRRSKM